MDLPCHGADNRAGEATGLEGWAARIAAGEDIVSAFRANVNDVVEHLVATETSNPECLAVAGTSRGGYMALHATAGNPFIRAAMAFAPVTDLMALSEFAGLQQDSLAQQLSLVNAVEQLADRAVWITIGKADTRVDTEKVVAFVRALEGVANNSGVQGNIALQVVPTEGHVSLAEWHDQAVAWLNNALNLRLPFGRIKSVARPSRP